MARQKTTAARRPMLPLRFARLHARLLVSIALGTAIALGLLAVKMHPATRFLTGWNIGILLYLTLIFSEARRGDITRLKKRAAEEDESAIVLLLLTFIAAVASLVALVIEIGGSQNTQGTQAVLQVVLAMGTIVLSWSFVHTEFALHYAHEFYGEGRDRTIGGLKFPGRAAPDYWDFLYFSLVVAMTSQVSDVAVTSRSLRRVVSMQGVLSFFFNLSIFALTVNLLSNLIGAK